MQANRYFLKTVAAAALTLACGYAAAADTQTVSVTATVNPVCKFSGAAATIAFGTIDPSGAAGDKTTAVSVPYKCTNGVTPAVTTGTIVPLTSGSNTMAFTLDTFAAVPGTGFSAAVNATSTARIADGVWQDAVAGSYTGSVVLNINN